MPAITDLWLSGGEPTLRHDASEIIDTFVRNNGVRRLIIPTNGLVKARVFEIVDQALGAHPSLDLYLNIALDGHGRDARSHTQRPRPLGENAGLHRSALSFEESTRIVSG